MRYIYFGLQLITGNYYHLNGECVMLERVHTKTTLFDGLEGLDFVEFKKIPFGHFTLESLDLERKILRCEIEMLEQSRGFITDHAIDSLGYTLPYNNSFLIDEETPNLPDRVFFNENKGATTLLYGDKATVVKTTKGDSYDRQYGFLLAFFQKHSGLSKTQANKYLKEIIRDGLDE